MQIELIAAAAAESASLPRMGLGILAALTPPEDEVVYTDEIVRRLAIAAAWAAAAAGKEIPWVPPLR